MKKRSRILTAVVMTVGLGVGVGGATAASATSTGAPKPVFGCAVKGGPAAMGEGRTTVRVDQDGKVFVDGKEAPKSKLRTLCTQPPLPGKGVVCIMKKADKGGKFKGETFRTDTFRDGKVFVDGKEAPKGKLRILCKEPPLPGKGAVCIVHVKGDESGEFGTSDEKSYADGKQAHAKCPPPGKPGEGMDDVRAGDDAPVAVTPN
ncbi:hypothetical protein [Microbispora triticiradicis]|uniref:Uncharacterized protein n=2 Tax=Microbispora TaxID=2005 RepID=A0ABY3M2Q1_9ACTN|nr:MULTISPECIES: hypothetical protein [Microbispora]TLP57732.1 hypothetical protein FED44_19295 [Microbispora fusca]TYB64671.1 hypothetical protein FXF59_07590 [Microbispora tritici]